MNESAKPSGPTCAHALHNFLQAVKQAGTPNLTQAWAKVLNAEWGSLDFAERHAEVISLWRNTIIQISSLAEERTRHRLRLYALSWYSALIMPDSSWDNINPRNAITDLDLDHLADTGDIIASQLGVVAQDNASLNELRGQCEEWISVLENKTEIAEGPLRLKLLGQIRHLLWLIDNAGAFGLARVVEHGDQVAGTLARTAYTRPDVVKRLADFRRRTGQLVLAIAVVTGVLTSTGAAVNAADQDLLAIEQLTHDAAHDAATPKVPNTEPSPDHRPPAP